jgi:hypothetical protein
MPNHVVNELVFRDVNPGTQGRIQMALCGATDKVDFEVLVPAPLNMWWGSVGIRHEQKFKRNHLDWARENWGTKWNAYQHRAIVRTDDSITFCFDTAWSPPYPWLAAVFNSLKLSFEHNWMTEGDNIGMCGYFNAAEAEKDWGDPWVENPAEAGEQKRLHVLRWGVESFPDDDAPPTPAPGEPTEKETI